MVRKILIFLIIVIFLTGCGNQKPALSEISPENTFGISETFEEMQMIVDTAFSNFQPQMAYDADNRMVVIDLTAVYGTARSLRFERDAILGNWNTAINELNIFSQSACETIKEAGFEVGCTVNLTSDSDPNQILFTSVNGFTTYNICSEE